MKRDKFIVGSRGSKLALIYTEKVMKFLKNVSSTEIEIKKIVTSGDENQKDRLSNIGGKGCLLYTSPSPRDLSTSRMPSSA